MTSARLHSLPPAAAVLFHNWGRRYLPYLGQILSEVDHIWNTTYNNISNATYRSIGKVSVGVD